MLSRCWTSKNMRGRPSTSEEVKAVGYPASMVYPLDRF